MNNDLVFERFESLYPPESWDKEITRLIGFIWSGNSAQIIGFPGVGRSNLLGLLSFNRACRQLHLGNAHNDIHFINMNFTEMRKKDEIEVLKFFFISIIDSLKERQMEAEYNKVREIFKESLEIPDAQVILSGLKKTVDLLSLEKNMTLVFLIDRFDEYIPYLTPEFFTDLRALRNRAKYKFSVVFSVARPLEETLDPSMYVDFYEFLEGNDIYLPLSDAASLNFRIVFLQMHAKDKITKEQISEILTLTAGHGKLTRLAIEALLESPPEGDLATFLLTKSKINTLFSEIWKGLTPSEQKFLKTHDPNLKSDYLEKANLVKDSQITIPLFAKWVEKTANETATDSNQKISYDSSTNEIKYGEIILSDSLTSSEFKLLKFFLENEGKVLGRDEIINAVWGDLSSTQGVSEQALDQLIFRVRKKIEENPNSPIHIATIKGRGFKFSS